MKDNGGPAYPYISRDSGGNHIANWPGMSLRDYFAGQCMRDTFAALAAAGFANFNEYQLQQAAWASYQAADALIAERNK